MELQIGLSHIRLQNLLSFGPEGIDLPLNPLSVFIGPNASGKSNLIEAIKIIKATVDTEDGIAKPISDGGGTSAYLWKGEDSIKDFASIDLAVNCLGHIYGYGLRFSCDHYGLLKLRNETINERFGDEAAFTEVYTLQGGPKYKGKHIIPSLDARQQSWENHDFDFDRNSSVISQLQNSDKYPEISHLRSIFSSIQIYEGWPLGSSFPPRHPKPVDWKGDFLKDDASNLAHVISSIDNKPGGIKAALLDNLQKIYPEIQNITPDHLNTHLYLRFHESQLNETIPAIRQSDGILRYLCLLTILLHPEPPPLICLEEPEIGLHPDAIGILGGLLKEASKRTQIIVTTHSDILVSELSDTPESVVICDRDSRGTRMERLDPDKLEKWLKDYSLGHLWLRGDLGGTL